MNALMDRRLISFLQRTRSQSWVHAYTEGWRQSCGRPRRGKGGNTQRQMIEEAFRQPVDPLIRIYILVVLWGGPSRCCTRARRHSTQQDIIVCAQLTPNPTPPPPSSSVHPILDYRVGAAILASQVLLLVALAPHLLARGVEGASDKVTARRMQFTTSESRCSQDPHRHDCLPD